MPEGDTLYRIERALAPVLEGRTIVEAASIPSPRVPAFDAPALVGRRVEAVVARGKHLFLMLDEREADPRSVVHSHLGMTGSWHLYRRGAAWTKPASRAGLALATRNDVAVLFSPELLELATPTALRRNGYLARLGPDMMRPADDLDAVLPRLRAHDATPIGEAVMNQTIACGIGNIYKSETLFLARLHPWTPVGLLGDDRLARYLADARRLMRLNRGSGPRRTRFEGDGVRFWVYGRRGEPCLLCGAVVLLRRQGDAGRTTFWCPRCQPAPRGVSATTDAAAQRRLPPIKGCG